MRQIKFRGKKLNSPNNEWVYGSYQHDIEWAKHYIWQQEKVGVYWQDVRHEVDGKTVGQLIGIKDRTGKDIFEQDIVDILYDVTPSNYEGREMTSRERRVICFYKGGFRLRLCEREAWGKSDHEVSDIMGFLGCHGKKPPKLGYIQVIGNEFENPELADK